MSLLLAHWTAFVVFVVKVKKSFVVLALTTGGNASDNGSACAVADLVKGMTCLSKVVGVDHEHVVGEGSNDHTHLGCTVVDLWGTDWAMCAEASDDGFAVVISCTALDVLGRNVSRCDAMAHRGSGCADTCNMADK